MGRPSWGGWRMEIGWRGGVLVTAKLRHHFINSLRGMAKGVVWVEIVDVKYINWVVFIDAHNTPIIRNDRSTTKKKTTQRKLSSLGDDLITNYVRGRCNENELWLLFRWCKTQLLIFQFVNCRSNFPRKCIVRNFIKCAPLD